MHVVVAVSNAGRGQGRNRAYNVVKAVKCVEKDVLIAKGRMDNTELTRCGGDMGVAKVKLCSACLIRQCEAIVSRNNRRGMLLLLLLLLMQHVGSSRLVAVESRSLR